MTNVNDLAPRGIPKNSITYPSISLDTAYGTVITVNLKRSQAVRQYIANIVEGSLVGGTSPAFTVSGTNPVITHFKLTADNDTILDFDADIYNEYEKLITQISPDGLNTHVFVADQEFQGRGIVLDATCLKTYLYSQVQLELTIAGLSTITSGSPTGTSGTTLYLTEEVISRQVADSFPTMVVKKLQNTLPTLTTGENDILTAIPQTGAYPVIVFQVKAGGTTLSNTDVSKIQLILNDVFTDTNTYFSALQGQNASIFGVSPDTGYALRVWSPDREIESMLNVSNPASITAIDLRLNGTSGDVVKLLRILYV